MTPSLIDRAQEAATLRGALKRAARGSGSLVLLYGTAGTGKSSLLTWTAAEAAQQGFQIVSARATDREREYAFGVARQLLQARVLAAPPAERGSLLADVGRAASPALGIPHDDDEPRDELAQIESLYWLVVRLASSGPLLIAVDDLQWSDRVSLDFLCYLAHRVSSWPVVVAGAWRRGEPSARAGRLQDVASEPETIFLDLVPLSPPGVGAVLHQYVSAPLPANAVDVAVRRTGGVPFLVTELARSLASEPEPDDWSTAIGQITPEPVRREIVARLARHPDHVRSLAHALAVFGAPATLETATKLAGIGPTEARRGADALVRAGILEHADALGFVSPIVRDAVSGSLSSVERTALHGRVVRVLLDEGGEVAESQLVPHLVRSDVLGDERCGRLLHDAALRAAQAGEPGLAARYLARALLEPGDDRQRREILTALARTEAQRHDYPAALAAIDRAGALPPGRENDLEPTLIAAEATDAMFGSERALTLLDDAVLRCAEADTEGRARIIGRQAVLRVAYGDWTGRSALEGIDVPGSRATAPADSIAAVIAHGVAAADGHADALGSASLDALGNLRARPGLEPIAHYLLARSAVLCGRLDGVEALVAGGDAAAGRTGVAAAACLRSLLAYRRGGLVAAARFARDALDALGTAPRGALDVRIHADASAVLVRVGLDRSLEAPAVSRDTARDRLGVRLTLMARLAADQVDAIRQILADGSADTGGSGAEVTGLCFPPLLARFHARTGDSEQAVAVATEHLEQMRAWGAPDLIGSARLTLGIVADPARRVAILEEAAGELERAGSPLEHARALLELGSTLRRGGLRTAAREQLALAADHAHRCGADVIAGRARDELVTLGARPRRAAFSGIDALTVSERRVADLAAQGMTNREIAQTLVVSTKTVSGQLGAVYRKLDVHDRAALVAALAADDPVHR